MEQIQQLEREKTASETTLKDHKKNASQAQEFYRQSVTKCKTDWKKIKAFEDKLIRTDEEDELTTMKHTFTLILSADHPQAKLIPYWGYAPQSASTYYYQKVSHDVLGITDHHDKSGYITLFDEKIGPKNTDHTVSLLQKQINDITQQNRWIRVIIFLDNATSTNKNRFLFGWGMEIIAQQRLDYLRFCFMVAGHTKFAPDRLFAQVSHSYSKQDVFTIEELKCICDPHANTKIEDGTAVLQWRELLSVRYSDLPGTRKYHNFLYARTHDDNVVMKVREFCYIGRFIDSPLSVINSSTAVVSTDNYKDTHFRTLSQEKMRDMILMYGHFIPPDHRPEYLPPLDPSTESPHTLAPTSTLHPSGVARPASRLKEEQVLNTRV